MRLTNPQTGLLLSLLCAVALGLNGYAYWQTGRIDARMLIPSLGLLALLVVMPFMAGWRGDDAPRGLRACVSCKQTWDPKALGTVFCPGCGAVPKGSPAAVLKHPYASPLRR